jgi:hypothetical protein
MKKSLGEIYLRIRITALSIATFVFLLTPPLAFADDYAQLEGCWQCQEDGESVTLEFKSRQQLLYNGEAYNYRLAPGVIQVQEGNNLVSYFFVLEGGALVILSPDGSGMQCQRAKKPKLAEAKPKSGKPTTQTRQAQPANQDWPPPQYLLVRIIVKINHKPRTPEIT